MAVVLSILVPTTDDRRLEFARLMDWLQPQLTDAVKVVPLETKSHTAGGPTTGAKRQQLIEQADTPFACMFDDDDKPASDYCSSILGAIDTGADMVVFDVGWQGKRLTFQFDGWWQTLSADGSQIYAPTPSHLSPIRREMALEVGYSDRTIGEDADYSIRLREKFDRKLHQASINRIIYEYQIRDFSPTILSER